MVMIKGGPGSQAGATVAVKSVKACVVYDAASGRIHHHHRVLTLEGGHEPDAAEMEEAALSHTANRRSGKPSGTLKVLHIAPDALEPAKRYRIDVAKQTLVAG
jgi:hypothetical protein